MIQTWKDNRPDKDGYQSIGPCEKDPNQMCSRAIRISRGGVTSQSVEGLSLCCKRFDEKKAMNKAISQCKAGVFYNGIGYTQNVIDSSKESYETFKDIEFFGPICKRNMRKSGDND